MRSIPVLRVVIPCYNEEAVLPVTAPLFLQELNGLVEAGLVSPKSKICFVNDGSKDDTWPLIRQLSESDIHFEGMSLSRNRGHQNALLAGLMEARGRYDICISIDCDGQDDIAVWKDMVQAYLDGSDVVYGVRSSRDTDTPFKRITAEGFYTVLQAMGVEVVFNHADYRLMSSRALDGLAEFGEANLFLRGLIPLVGYPSVTVEYERAERMAGESHYPLGKMISLAIDGVTSLSVKPIRVLSLSGIAFSVIGFLGVVWAIVAFATGQVVSGWASTVCFICLFGGLQLFALGIIGEYIGKIYLEVKNRPRFLVSERTWDR